MAHEVRDDAIVTETLEEIEAFVKEPGRVHYIALAMQGGVAECIHTLELQHYVPRTPRNDLFHIRAIIWGDLCWLLVSIPDTERHFMKTVSTAHGLRITNGIPQGVTTEVIEQFPIKGLNVFTLVTVGRIPVYRRIS